MIEPLYGSSAPNWAGVPSPALSWLQPGISRPAPFAASGFAAVQPNQQGLTGATASVPAVPTNFRPTWESSPASGSVYGPQPYGFANGGFTSPVQTGLVFGPPGPPSGPMISSVPGVFGMYAVPPQVGQEFSWGPGAILTAVAMRRGQPMGPTTDQEVEEFLYDALELFPGTSEVDVRCEGGRATLTGSVQHKRLKHDVGEIAWSIPHISDVQNNVTIATRRRSRSAQREPEPVSTAATRK
jgi:hypothetical protein